MGDMNYNPYENPNNNSSGPNPFPAYQPPVVVRGNAMEAIAMFLGSSSLILCSCLYLSIPMGAMAVLFALLSRGGGTTLSSKAKTALCLGIAGIIVTAAFYSISIYVAIQEAGSLEELLRETCEMYGYDFETLFGEYFK